MRDPKRIPVVLEEIRKVWEHYPDLRLCQLIENAGGHFYTEDEAFVENLKKWHEHDLQN